MKNYLEHNSERIIKLIDALFPSSRDRSVFMSILFDMEIATLDYDDRLSLYTMLLRRIRNGMNDQEAKLVFEVLREYSEKQSFSRNGSPDGTSDYGGMKR